MKQAIVAFGVIAFLAPVTVHADPIGIRVLNATYSTTITFGINDSTFYPYITTTVAGSNSVSQSAEYFRPPGIDPYILSTASASADWLAVSASSRSVPTGCPCMPVSSSADFEVTFSPLTDGLALIDIIGELAGPYTDTSATLFDETVGQELWRFSHSRSGGLRTVALPTDLSATHVYDLHLSIVGESLTDSTGGSIAVVGLHVVPEPSSLLLLVTGLAGVGVFRRARTRKPRASEHAVYT